MIVGSLLGLAEAVLGKGDAYRGLAVDRPLSVEDRQLVHADDDGAAARGHAAALRGAGQLDRGYGDGERMRRGAGAPGRSAARSGRAGCNRNPAQVKRDGCATYHTVWDTFASWLVQRGVSLFKVQQLLGIRARR
jgi:hypothetical protein